MRLILIAAALMMPIAARAADPSPAGSIVVAPGGERVELPKLEVVAPTPTPVAPAAAAPAPVVAPAATAIPAAPKKAKRKIAKRKAEPGVVTLIDGALNDLSKGVDQIVREATTPDAKSLIK